jgi:ATP adenylyltransferase
MVYIKSKEDESGCMFCNQLAMKDGPENLILHRGQNAFVILNRFPYTNGHMMVVPYEHQASIEALATETLSELMQLTSTALTVLHNVYEAQNFNIGINIGEAAGAGIVEHVHIHIVPRWAGDTNFMTTTAETRVIPEALDEAYQALRYAWHEHQKGNPDSKIQ